MAKAPKNQNKEIKKLKRHRQKISRWSKLVISTLTVFFLPVPVVVFLSIITVFQSKIANPT